MSITVQGMKRISGALNVTWVIEHKVIISIIKRDEKHNSNNKNKL